MIAAEDVQFHTPPEPPYDWAETRFFSVFLPEANVTAWAYMIARPGVGAIACDVEAIDHVGTSPLEAVYIDFQQHLPLPDKWQSFTLPNGLSLETSGEPRDYRLHYIGNDDTEFSWDVEGLMEPYDISDPRMDPLATGDPEDSGFGQAYANHFDMAARITGTTRIRGRSFDTDCVTVMDHSWGPRNERLMRPMGWINASFGDDYVVHTIWARDTAESGWGGFTFAHGFALVDGEVRGLKSGRLRATRARNQMPVQYEMSVVDVDDREHVLVGSPLAQHHWACYSNSYVPFSSVRWQTFDGRRVRTGQGVAQENCPLDRLTGWSAAASVPVSPLAGS
ncbi:DUF7065 domain-containing protein [Geodermatophilus sabuli]|uniref:Uncharacterized protein n=1 Tax=Geodermatophilus sabuli TaxID=1564158 RepID=A0A285E6N0_9ACTN|nr:hypothetical protein [Geodermatophilus sabuli]MBB3082362.1 hypothetical protein [Geodermatophilus sabuli]SNX94768.1 hypothetical protein SAMN06893097_101565 [Geodermatophilus sabuli]